jgi:hypothetical protein
MHIQAPLLSSHLYLKGTFSYTKCMNWISIKRPTFSLSQIKGDLLIHYRFDCITLLDDTSEYIQVPYVHLY